MLFRFVSQRTWLPLPLFAVLLFPFIATAQQAPQDKAPEATPAPGGVAAIQRRIDALQSDRSVADAVRDKVLALYREALKQQEALATYELQSESYRQALRTAPDQIRTIRQKLERAIAAEGAAQATEFAGMSLDALEQLRQREQTRFKELNDQLAVLESDLRHEIGRAPEIRPEQSSTRNKLIAILEQLQLPDNGKQSPLEAKARRLLLDTAAKALAARINMLELEAQSQSPRIELLKARSDLVVHEAGALSERLERIDAALEKMRSSEADRFRKELAIALEAATGKHALIQEAIRENAELGFELNRVVEETASINARKEAVAARVKEIGKSFASAEKKIHLAGLSPALGAVLRSQRQDLPNTSRLQVLADQLQETIAKASLAQIENEERLKLMADVRRQVEKTIAINVDPSLPKEERLRIRVELGALMETRKTLLERLVRADNAYLLALGELETAAHDLIDTAHRYGAFLDEHLLWIPSSPPLDRYFVSQIVESLAWLATPAPWRETAEALQHSIAGRPIQASTGVLVIAGLLTMRWRIRRRLGEIAARVSKPFTDRFSYTVVALLYTVLLTVPFFLAVYLPGWLLKSNPVNPEFARAVGVGLCSASIPLFFLNLFAILFQPGGIAAVHLRWKQRTLDLLRHQIQLIRPVAVAMIFLIAMTGAQSVVKYSDSLGRLALMVGMTVMSLLLGLFLKPTGGVFEKQISAHPRSWLARLRFLWYPAAVLIPLVIVGFAAAGYYMSALELQQKLVIVIRMIFLAIVVHQLVLRWLMLVNRQMAIRQAQEKYRTEHGGKGSVEMSEEGIQLDLGRIDIRTINLQTRKLLNLAIGLALVLGIFIVVRDLLPAFSVFNKVVLWYTTDVIDGVEQLQPVTLVDVVFALLYVVVFTTAVVNLPGLLEVLVLRRLTIQPGSRFAIVQLSRYTLVTLATVVVADRLGARWSQLQWLVAALSVGLGFGLQEIVANFVSGIILLFERPIRLGDTVTVGNVTGTVSRLQIRATTLTDWDRKELIVPNKTFITEQLVNWNLTDSVTRLLIPVGIAYGSDTTLAHKVMTDAVRSTPLVLDDPEPTVLFTGFGDSALNFEIRVFVKELSNRLPTLHQLHMRIDQALREAGIEIPFPQRDLHLRSVSPEASAGFGGGGAGPDGAA